MLERLSPHEFLAKFHLADNALETTGISWTELLEIGRHFERNIPDFEQTGFFLARKLGSIDGVHSLRSRVKDPEHLAAKIVRKRLANPHRVITIANYQEEITDLVGLRVLHLFKENWQSIHDYIRKEWQLAEDPTAYIREGDPVAQREMFLKGGCVVRPHKDSYRSVHYLVRTYTSTMACVAELQVRTLFEEAWSEIDHLIRYPYKLDNRVLNEFLIIFNRVAGQADEMGSFVTYLAAILDEKERLQARRIEGVQNGVPKEVRQAINNLQESVRRLAAPETEKRELEERLKSLMDATERATSQVIYNSPINSLVGVSLATEQPETPISQVEESAASASSVMPTAFSPSAQSSSPHESAQEFDPMQVPMEETQRFVDIATSPVDRATSSVEVATPVDTPAPKPIRTSQQMTFQEFLEAYRRAHESI